MTNTISPSTNQDPTGTVVAPPCISYKVILAHSCTIFTSREEFFAALRHFSPIHRAKHITSLYLTAEQNASELQFILPHLLLPDYIRAMYKGGRAFNTSKSSRAPRRISNLAKMMKEVL